MKRRILSIISSVAAFAMMLTVTLVQTEASETESKKVDGSYLTTQESSTGYSYGRTRGVDLMTGDCTISKAGRGRVYAYASTTATHEVKYIATIVYVDRYLEDVDEWGQVDWWMEDVENDIFLSTAKTVYVDRGYYYRVRAHHIAGNASPYDETASVTDGILIN